jgi:hypothetical protein
MSNNRNLAGFTDSHILNLIIQKNLQLNENGDNEYFHITEDNTEITPSLDFVHVDTGIETKIMEIEPTQVIFNTPVSLTSLSLSGDLDMNDNDIINANEISGNSGTDILTINDDLIVNGSGTNNVIRIGDMGHNNQMGFRHNDLTLSTEFALLQNTSGKSVLNSATGNSTDLRIGNVSIASVRSSGFNVFTGNTYQINTTEVLSNNTLGSGIVNSSLTNLGTLTSLDVTGDLTVNTNTLFVDTTLNRVGIGTITPSFDFDLVDNANSLRSVFRLLNSNNGASAGINGIISTSGGGDAQIRFNASGGGGNAFALGIDTSNNVFSINDGTTLNSTGLVIDASNNVGIGTTNPLVKLDVNGDINGDLISGKNEFYRGFSNAVQVISDDVDTVVDIDTDDVNFGSIYSNSNGTITINKTGLYLVNYKISIEGDATGFRTMVIRHQTSGSSLINENGKLRIAPSSSTTDFMSNSGIINVQTSGDLVELFLFQNSGGNLNSGDVDTTETLRNEITIYRLGEHY